jgi:hypothetical protein
MVGFKGKDRGLNLDGKTLCYQPRIGRCLETIYVVRGVIDAASLSGLRRPHRISWLSDRVDESYCVGMLRRGLVHP